jgi:hypothetical protein
MSTSDSESVDYSSSEEENNKIADTDFDPTKFFKSQKELCYYKLVHSYFKTCDSNEIKKMVDIINGSSNISLRILDWFITKYSKKRIDFNVDGRDMFNINILYKAQLKSFKKKNFDPFRRRSRFYYQYEKGDPAKKIETTLGQLNFFRWAISNKIIDYVEKNIVHITKAMNMSNKEDKKKKKEKTKKKQKELKKPIQKDNSSLKVSVSKTIDGDEIKKFTLTFD